MVKDLRLTDVLIEDYSVMDDDLLGVIDFITNFSNLDGEIAYIRNTVINNTSSSVSVGLNISMIRKIAIWCAEVISEYEVKAIDSAK